MSAPEHGPDPAVVVLVDGQVELGRLTLLGERAWWPRRRVVVPAARVEETDQGVARLGG
ncbi:hypothetical protein [Nocardioides sp.]|uniref:hypothetical protein n=1 Tax=Nocardioides sp. TaxID=35761 RepID=UPI0039E5D927